MKMRLWDKKERSIRWNSESLVKQILSQLLAEFGVTGGADVNATAHIRVDLAERETLVDVSLAEADHKYMLEKSLSELAAIANNRRLSNAEKYRRVRGLHSGSLGDLHYKLWQLAEVPEKVLRDAVVARHTILVLPIRSDDGCRLPYIKMVLILRYLCTYVPILYGFNLEHGMDLHRSELWIDALDNFIYKFLVGRQIFSHDAEVYGQTVGLLSDIMRTPHWKILHSVGFHLIMRHYVSSDIALGDSWMIVPRVLRELQIVRVFDRRLIAIDKILATEIRSFREGLEEGREVLENLKKDIYKKLLLLSKAIRVDSGKFALDEGFPIDSESESEDDSASYMEEGELVRDDAVAPEMMGEAVPSTHLFRFYSPDQVRERMEIFQREALRTLREYLADVSSIAEPSAAHIQGIFDDTRIVIEYCARSVDDAEDKVLMAVNRLLLPGRACCETPYFGSNIRTISITEGEFKQLVRQIRREKEGQIDVARVLSFEG